MYAASLRLEATGTRDVRLYCRASCWPKGNHCERATKSKVTVKRWFRMAEKS